MTFEQHIQRALQLAKFLMVPLERARGLRKNDHAQIRETPNKENSKSLWTVNSQSSKTAFLISSSYPIWAKNPISLTF